MIAPMIHRLLGRDDLARLVAEIARRNPRDARPAATALETGAIDNLLDSPAALHAVRGGSAPAPLPLTLLWYVPVRAHLRKRGLTDIELADYAATLPVVFTTNRATRRVANGERGLAAWWSAIDAMPSGTVAQGERAADCGALALWWAGCFPEAVARKGGTGMVRAYVTFAARSLALAAAVLAQRAPDAAGVFTRAAKTAESLWKALFAVREEYLGSGFSDGDGQLKRLLATL